MKFDKETAEHMREGETLRNFVESEGWAIAKKLLLDRIHLLDSVSSIPSNLSFEEIGKQAMFRAHAISLVMDWIDSIEGRVEQHDEQARVAADLVEVDIVRTYSSST